MSTKQPVEGYIGNTVSRLLNQGWVTGSTYPEIMNNVWIIIKRPARDACLCMGELQAPAAPHFVFLITL